MHTVTDELNFYQGSDPAELTERFGSPLYVYNERILRERCREVMAMAKYPNVKVNYSAKANSNLRLLKIVKEEGLCVDAISPGEIYLEELAGFRPDEIFYVGNNLSEDDMRYGIERNILMSCDSLSQLERYGKLAPGGRVAVRFNPGVGAGHHEKVVTGGDKSKFGVNPEYTPEVLRILDKYGLKLAGINQHIGSLFMDGEAYLQAFDAICGIALIFKGLEFIDLGGGFGIPYNKGRGGKRLDMNALGEKLGAKMFEFAERYGRDICFKLEPGRYISAECGVLLGKCTSVKQSGGTKYAGTDIGFNVLMRPVMYGAKHEIELYGADGRRDETVTIVGNICESGDILAQDITMPEIMPGDTLAVLDAGAYGYSMSGNYNGRPRPAELFINADGGTVLTRKRDTFEDLARGFV